MASKLIKAASIRKLKRERTSASSFIQCPACQANVALRLLNFHLDSDCLSLTPLKTSELPSQSPEPETQNAVSSLSKCLRLLQAPPVLAMKGYRLVDEFVSLEEEQHLLSCLGMDQNNPWKISVFSGFTRNKSYGLIAAFSRRQVLPAKFEIPKFLAPVVERMRSIEELANFHPNELNSLEYLKEEGHFLRPHVDDRQLSGELIVNLSLCGDCDMTFKRERGAYECHRIRLKRRSLQILSGESRYNFTHAITNEDLLSPRRVSITFREVALTHDSNGRLLSA